MLLKSLITKSKNHLVSIGSRYFILRPNGQLLRESSLEEYEHVSNKCKKQGTIYITPENCHYLENSTTRNGQDLIRYLSANDIAFLLGLKNISDTLYFPVIHEVYYFLFDSASKIFIVDTCYDERDEHPRFNMSGLCILNKKELTHLYNKSIKEYI